MGRVPIDLFEQMSEHKDFAKLVFDAWDGRDGRDASGVQVRFEKHLRKRWNAEGEQWRNNCHTAQKKASATRPMTDEEILREAT
jgi:hypothetical protein